jgi:hypothetical protein
MERLGVDYSRGERAALTAGPRVPPLRALHKPSGMVPRTGVEERSSPKPLSHSPSASDTTSEGPGGVEAGGRDRELYRRIVRRANEARERDVETLRPSRAGDVEHRDAAGPNVRGLLSSRTRRASSLPRRR